MRKLYDTDLNPSEWQVIQYLFPRAKKLGRRRTYSRWSVVNSILYVLRTGCAWRLLPNDLPPWPIVYHYYREWKIQGLWARINLRLTEKVRIAAGREASPSAGIIDSQSVKASDTCQSSGFDGGKKINGRKRHILVDVLGLLIAVVVTSASTQDREGAIINYWSRCNSLPRLQLLWADGGYTGPFIPLVKKIFGWIVEIIKPVTNKGPGFHVRP